MITDLVQIRRLGEQKRGENEKFRRHIKSHNFVERRFRELAQEVEGQIDCLQCANCCRVATVRLTERDIEKLCKHLRLKRGQFMKQYTVESEDEGVILKRDEILGCVFLSGTECQIYEVRPAICEDFPHLIRGAGSLQSRMWEFIDRAVYCPIVYNALEAWKKETGFTPKV
jgi:uncharacterized protein